MLILRKPRATLPFTFMDMHTNTAEEACLSIVRSKDVSVAMLRTHAAQLFLIVMLCTVALLNATLITW